MILMLRSRLQCFFGVLCFFLPPLCLYGQNFTERPEFKKANSVWIFGYGVGIDFNGTTPLPLSATMPAGVYAPEAAASIADTATGDLLFYSNAAKCCNRNYQVMPNGNGLSGGNSTAQGACIVPMIDSPGKYYLFYSQAYFAPSPRLYYSVVDMSLDGGLGDIVPGRKNILLDSGPLGEMMAAVPGSNCDVWLLVHAYNDAEFKAYHITRNGIDPAPVVSTTSTAFAGPGAYEMGGMAVSPDGTKVAVTTYSPACVMLGLVPSSGGTMIAEFDPATGVISNDLKICDSTMGYGICFSPDNSKLYIEGLFIDSVPALNPGPLPGLTPKLLQYDVSTYNAAAIIASRTVIYASPYPYGDPNGEEGLAGLRRHDDVIIKADAFGELNHIPFPNLAGTACGYQPYLVLNPSTTGGLGLGSDAVYPRPPDTITYPMMDTLICSGEPVSLAASPGYDTYLWDDGSSNSTRAVTEPGTYRVLCLDRCHSREEVFVLGLKEDVRLSLGPDTIVCGSPPLQLSADVPQSNITITWQDGSTGGTYNVTTSGIYWAEASKSGCTDTDSVAVTFRNLKQDLGSDALVCRNEPVDIALTANVPPGAAVLWNTGSTTPDIRATDTGMYWVQVSDPPCAGSDTLRIIEQVCDCVFDMPSAFSPNNDGRNDIFHALLENQCPVKMFVLDVYNRWGQRVYGTVQAHKGWDGTFNGVPAEAGVYMYEVRVRVGVREREYHKKGDVLLVR